MDKPTQRYHEVARLFRDLARYDAEGVAPQPATAEDLAAAEDALECRFPDSYRWFQLEFGDFQRGSPDIYSVKAIDPPRMNIVGINLDERSKSYPPLPPHLIAFSDSGGGDFCCFDTSALESGECPIVWWDHEQDETQQPEIAGRSLLDWLEAELKERAAEGKGSLLDSIRYVHQGWMKSWLKNKPRE